MSSPPSVGNKDPPRARELTRILVLAKSIFTSRSPILRKSKNIATLTSVHRHQIRRHKLLNPLRSPPFILRETYDARDIHEIDHNTIESDRIELRIRKAHWLRIREDGCQRCQLQAGPSGLYKVSRATQRIEVWTHSIQVPQ